MLIRVGTKHIKMGQYSNPKECPVALAIKDNVGNMQIYVDKIKIVLCTKYGRKIEFPCPRSVRRFIKKFDNYGKSSISPFNFKLSNDILFAENPIAKSIF